MDHCLQKWAVNCWVSFLPGRILLAAPQQSIGCYHKQRRMSVWHTVQSPLPLFRWGLKWYLVHFWDILHAIVLWFKALKQADNSFPDPVKFFPFSDGRTCGAPPRVMNLSTPITRELVSMEITTSISRARVVRHLKRDPWRFSVERLTAIKNGPKYSIPELEKRVLS